MQNGENVCILITHTHTQRGLAHMEIRGKIPIEARCKIEPLKWSVLGALPGSRGMAEKFHSLLQ